MLKNDHTPPTTRFSRESFEIFSTEIAPTTRVRRVVVTNMVEVIMGDYSSWNID